MAIDHISSGEQGLPVRNKLNEVIDIVNNLGGTANNTGLLSDFIFFRNKATNPSTPDYDITMFAYNGMLQWTVNGTQYDYDLTANGYDIVIDEFTGLATESRIDLIYTLAPPDPENPATFILVRKGTNAVTPVAPALNTGEVFLGFAFINVNGITNLQSSGLRIRSGQQDVPGANKLILDATKQSFFVNENSNEIRLIRKDDFVEGDLVPIIILPGQVLKHDYPVDGDFKPLQLAKSGDFTATQKIALIFEAHDNNGDNEIDEFIEVAGTSIIAEVERNSYVSQKKQAFADQVDDTSFIYGFSSSDLTDCTVEASNGNLGVQITDDRIEFTESGNAYNVIVYDSLSAVKYIIPLSEGNDIIDVRQEIVTGKKLRIANLVGIQTQDNFFANHSYGADELERTSDNEIYYVPFKTDKTSNYIE